MRKHAPGFDVSAADSDDNLLTVAELAEYLHYRPKSVYNLIGQGAIGPEDGLVRVRRDVRFVRSIVRARILSGKFATGPECVPATKRGRKATVAREA